MPESNSHGVLTAEAALQRLKEGNRRFASNVRSVDSLLSQLRRADLAVRQEPFAVILGCSDSRAPAEIVFDQGLGDLFVIRVAGNIVAASQVGSVEFAVERFHTRLVVVMGHTSCGAIDAAIEANGARLAYSKNVLSIVDRVRPSVEAVIDTVVAQDKESLARAVVRANVRASVDHLCHGSGVIEGLMANDGLVVAGAVYDLASGAVEWLPP